MAQHLTPKLKNDAGVATVRVGVKEFECMGASPPFDHPHVYLDMGRENEIICPYCSTLYVFDANLGAEETEPANAIHHDLAHV